MNIRKRLDKLEAASPHEKSPEMAAARYVHELARMDPRIRRALKAIAIRKFDVLRDGGDPKTDATTRDMIARFNATYHREISEVRARTVTRNATPDSIRRSK